MQVTNDQNLIDTIARYYVERGALSIGDFALVGGGRSDFYIDGRLITTHTTALKQIAQVFSHHIREKVLLGPHDTLIAPVLSGIPVAVATALELNVDYVMDRGVAKEHGIGRRFEGAFNDGARCLIVDDLITVGSTVVNTIKELVAD